MRLAASKNYYEITNREHSWLKFLWKVIIARVFLALSRARSYLDETLVTAIVSLHMRFFLPQLKQVVADFSMILSP